MTIQFADFELDPDLFELRKGGELIAVEPKVFGLIAHFAANPDQVFTNDQLIEAVWSGRTVSDTTISSCIKNARKALGDTGEAQQFIKTVRGRGFRFVAIVKSPASMQDSAAANHPQARQTEDQHDPSLLVLPFRPLTDSPECAALSTDLATRIGTVLTRIPLLKLSAQTFRYVGQAVYPSVRELHESLGVDYVIEGGVQASANQVSVHVQLLDARTGFSLWAEKLDVPADTTDPVQAATVAVIAKVEPQLVRAIYQSVCSLDGAPTARRLYLEASGLLSLKGYHYKSFPVAIDLLRQSRALSPDFAHASGYLSLVLGLGNRLGILEGREKLHDEAMAAAEDALQADSMDSTVLGLAGCALADLGHPSRAVSVLEQAIDLNPANAQAWVARGSVFVMQRELDAGIEKLRHGMSISPLDSRLSIWGSILAIALLMRGRLDEAQAEAEIACRREYGAYWSRIALAAILHQKSDMTGASRALDDAYGAAPDLTPEQIQFLVGHKFGQKLVALRAGS
ncbi:MAG: winged helix-turn-helix domain-containing tetratricopeptide repeat protein [Burkholderiaceae bacterium]